jgi:hypothetical protein
MGKVTKTQLIEDIADEIGIFIEEATGYQPPYYTLKELAEDIIKRAKGVK